MVYCQRDCVAGNIVDVVSNNNAVIITNKVVGVIATIIQQAKTMTNIGGEVGSGGGDIANVANNEDVCFFIA